MEGKAEDANQTRPDASPTLTREINRSQATLPLSRGRQDHGSHRTPELTAVAPRPRADSCQVRQAPRAGGGATRLGPSHSGEQTVGGEQKGEAFGQSAGHPQQQVPVVPARPRRCCSSRV